MSSETAKLRHGVVAAVIAYLAPHGRVTAIIANPGARSAGTFDPTRATGLPPIAGVDYSTYIAALQGAAAN